MSISNPDKVVDYKTASPRTSLGSWLRMMVLKSCGLRQSNEAELLIFDFSDGVLVERRTGDRVDFSSHGFPFWSFPPLLDDQSSRLRK